MHTHSQYTSIHKYMHAYIHNTYICTYKCTHIQTHVHACTYILYNMIQIYVHKVITSSCSFSCISLVLAESFSSFPREVTQLLALSLIVRASGSKCNITQPISFFIVESSPNNITVKNTKHVYIHTYIRTYIHMYI